MKFRLLTLLLLGVSAFAQVPAPQILLTGTGGSGGNFPFLNSGSFAIPSDMDFTAQWPNTSCIVCNVTSTATLTATRNLIEPALGMTFNITNSTTGGQSIVVKASTGSGVTIPNGASKWVWFNGINYVEVDSASAISIATANGFQGSSSGGTSPTLTISTDSSHFLPGNTSGSTCYWNGVGNCTVPAGSSYSLGGTLSNTNCSLGTGAGTGASCTLGGLDGSFIINVTTGTSPAAGPAILATVTFTASRGHTAYCTISPNGVPPFSIQAVQGSASPTSFELLTETTASASTVYEYIVSCP